MLAECRFERGISAEQVWDVMMWDPGFQAAVRKTFGDDEVEVGEWEDADFGEEFAADALQDGVGDGSSSPSSSSSSPSSPRWRRRTCTFLTPIHEPLCPAWGAVTEAWVARGQDRQGTSVAAAVATTEGVPFGDLFDVETRFLVQEDREVGTERVARLVIAHRVNIHKITLKFKPFVRRMRKTSRREAHRAARSYMDVLAARDWLLTRDY